MPAFVWYRRPVKDAIICTYAAPKLVISALGQRRDPFISYVLRYQPVERVRHCLDLHIVSEKNSLIFQLSGLPPTARRASIGKNVVLCIVREGNIIGGSGAARTRRQSPFLSCFGWVSMANPVRMGCGQSQAEVQPPENDRSTPRECADERHT